jgi:predicted ferric reductase
VAVRYRPLVVVPRATRVSARPAGIALLMGLVLIPVALWATMSPLGPRFATLASASTNLAIALGLAGTASFALNLVLGGRLWFFEDLFGGLDRMYRVHQRNGRAAYLLLLSHVLLMIAASASESVSAALHLFIPSGNGAVFIGVAAFLLMTVAISLTLFALLEHEVFVWVQRSFGAIFVIAIFHIFRVPAVNAASRALTLYLAALALFGISAWIYRSVFGDVLVRRHVYTVTKVNRLADRVTEIAMQPVASSLHFLPGQFLYVTFQSRSMSEDLHPVAVSPHRQTATLTLRPGDIATQFHPFSITSSPHEPELSVAAKAVGDYTSAMRGLVPGDVARVEGPYGAFSYRKAPSRRQIWISGGIGITPFLSMAKELDAAYEVDLYYCTKSLPAAVFLNDLNAVANRHPSFRIIPFPEDVQGHITVRDVEQISEGFRNRDILICGPPAMIENLTDQFVTRGVPKRQIHFERFGFIPKSN